MAMPLVIKSDSRPLPRGQGSVCNDLPFSRPGQQGVKEEVQHLIATVKHYTSHDTTLSYY